MEGTCVIYCSSTYGIGESAIIGPSVWLCTFLIERNNSAKFFYGLLLAAAQDVLPCGIFKAWKPSHTTLHSKIVGGFLYYQR